MAARPVSSADGVPFSEQEGEAGGLAAFFCAEHDNRKQARYLAPVRLLGRRVRCLWSEEEVLGTVVHFAYHSPDPADGSSEAGEESIFGVKWDKSDMEHEAFTLAQVLEARTDEAPPSQDQLALGWPPAPEHQLAPLKKLRREGVHSPFCKHPDCQDAEAQLRALQRQWKEAQEAGMQASDSIKRLRGFVGGDFEGMLKLLGLAGASGTYPCMFCLAHHTETLKAGVPHVPRMPEAWLAEGKFDTRDVAQQYPAKRTGKSLEDESRAYLEKLAAALEENGTKPQQGSSSFHNAIASPIVEAGSYIIYLMSGGPLHIDLGVGLLLFNITELLCRAIDDDIAAAKADALPAAEKAAATQSKKRKAAEVALKKAHDVLEALEAEAERVSDAISDREARMMHMEFEHPEVKERCKPGSRKAGDTEQDAAYRTLLKQRADLVKARTSVESKVDTAKKAEAKKQEELSSVEKGVGPREKKVHMLLRKAKLARNSYHGGSFNGNEINKIFTTEFILELCSFLRACEEPGLSGEYGCNITASRVQACLLAFYSCRQYYSRKEPLCDHELKRFSVLLDELAHAFAVAFPDSKPTPKLHYLLYHHLELMWCFGSVGQFTEQAVEGFHPLDNRARVLYSSVREQSTNIALRAKWHWHSSNPEAVDLHAKRQARLEKRRFEVKVESFK